MTKAQIRVFGKKLKEWAYSEFGDKLLCSHECTQGAASWVCGGCVPLGLALLEVLPGSELYAIWADTAPPPWFARYGMKSRRRPEHIGVMLNGLFIDGRGARLPRSVEKWWAAELTRPKMSRVTEHQARNIIADPPEERDPAIDDLVAILIPILEEFLVPT